MKKYSLEVTRKNGEIRTVAVYLDEETAELLERAGDEKLLNAYLLEEYKASRRERQERFWTHSLEEDMENSLDFEDKHIEQEFSIEELESEELQGAIERLTPRQQEILRLLYIEGRSQKEISELYHITKAAVNNALQRIYCTLKRILQGK